MKMKPMIGAVAAGAVLAAGGLAAVQLGTSDAEAQSSTQAQINALEKKLAAEQMRTVAALKRSAFAWNGQNRYTSPAGTAIPGTNTPKVTQMPTVGGGWQPNSLDSDVQMNWPYWVKNYYNGTQNTWTGRGVTNVQREAVGVYRVTYSKPIAGCAYTVTPGYYNGGEPTKYAIAQVYNGNATNNVVVKTYNAGAGGADVTAADFPWQGQVVCNPSTMTSSP